MRYYALKNDFRDSAERNRITKRLVALKEDLAKKIPQKLFNENILIATWNIRDFDSNKFGHGPRIKESFYYLAEIISAYDLVALQEVNDNLQAFNKLMYILGEDWDYIMTDVTGGSSGNGERMVFVYDTKRVSFKKLAGEIVLTDRNLVSDNLQFARTPFIVSFQSGWFSFKLCTVHIYYGATSGDKFERRVDEIGRVAKLLSTRAKKYDENLILLGDFNIVSPEHETMEALEKNGFKIPSAIKQKPVYTNMKQTMYYDQIAYREKKGEVILANRRNSAGAYNYFNKVFTTRQRGDYEQDIRDNIARRVADKLVDKAKAKKATDKEKIQNQIDDLNAIVATKTSIKNYYRDTWRTFQMSDHLPLWTELKINFSISYLKKIHEEVKAVED